MYFSFCKHLLEIRLNSMIDYCCTTSRENYNNPIMSKFSNGSTNGRCFFFLLLRVREYNAVVLGCAPCCLLRTKGMVYVNHEGCIKFKSFRANFAFASSWTVGGRSFWRVVSHCGEASYVSKVRCGPLLNSQLGLVNDDTQTQPFNMFIFGSLDW